jgi:small subunit ribosomal protein S20
MANSKSAAKRARQTTKRNLENKQALSGIRSLLRNVRSDIALGKKEQAEASFRKTVSALDRAVKSGRIHRNTASRKKSALNRALAALS